MIVSLEQHISAAWNFIQIDDASQAMHHAKEAHKLSPNSPDVAHLLGLLASRDGQANIALPLLQKAIDTGGKTARRLRDMAEALFTAGFAEQALIPLNEAIDTYGASSEALGLRSAIEIELEQWQQAAVSAQKAIALKPNLLAWELNYSFAELIQLNLEEGFKQATGRTESLASESRCPAVKNAEPCAVWLKGEQGIGDTLYYLRFIPALIKKGWQFHLEVDRKLIPILEKTHYFASIKDKNPAPKDAFWLNVGDLALMAQQCGVDAVVPPLHITPNKQQVEKIKAELASFGPSPYIAVTWRGGPKGRKQRNGVRMLEKVIDPTVLGTILSKTNATIINIQRVPVIEEMLAFNQALGRKSADFTALNNNLAGMLALLSLVDDYITVSNTNLHLRESVFKPSQVFVNRPFKDWRWLAEGEATSWYPSSIIYRQEKNGDWGISLQKIAEYLSKYQIVQPDFSVKNELVNAEEIKESIYKRIIQEGWDALDSNLPLAIKNAQEVLSEQPNYARALHLLGWAAVQDFKFDIACQALAKAAELAPNDGIICRDLIRALSLNNQSELAIKIAEQSLANPEMRSKSAIHYAKAGVHFKIGENLKAITEYDNCLKINPNNLEALGFAGMLRVKLGKGHARLGFKQYSARKEAQMPHNANAWCCPLLKGDIAGLNVLITRDMGLGDELSYLRYLPWLVEAGANVTYWCGAKLKPLLERLPHKITIVPDNLPCPNIESFDLVFIVNELPAAVEHLGAPEIADPLPLLPKQNLVEKWQAWLKVQGEGPYIGFNWRAGVANAETQASFTKLAKAVEPDAFAKALNGVRGTWVSLQRNVTKAELADFSQVLGAPVSDASGLTDDLDDLLALLSVLDANVGVSNTNMHLRAGLGLSSHVLVQFPGGDWRWGTDEEKSQWFTNCPIYRQSEAGDWQPALTALHKDLLTTFGEVAAKHQNLNAPLETSNQITKRIIWLTAGNLIQDELGNITSVLGSTRNRVLAPAKGLIALGWQSDFINETFSQTMGGWGQYIPQVGDTVIVSKVLTEHGIKMAKDAKARGAQLIVDFCDNFLDKPKRAPLQKLLASLADKVVCSEAPIAAAFAELVENEVTVIDNIDLDNINQSLVLLWLSLITSNLGKATKPSVIVSSTTANALKRVLVGMMYSGEQEYEQAKQALQNQTHQIFEFFEVKNLPNKLAHDTLYDNFMARASEFDYFLKLDADMVFAHDNVLSEMVEIMAIENHAHLFAYVKDCPSGLMIPGIQMFRSDCTWAGSEEQLNVDYLPKINGTAKHLLDKNWILHMPNPSKEQLFRYGIHKALKAIQPNRVKKSQRKGMTHINILAGIARNVNNQPNLQLSLMGATLVFEGQFSSIEYAGTLTEKYLKQLNDTKFYEKLNGLSQEYWGNEVQIYYRWLDKFSQNTFSESLENLPQIAINKQISLTKRLIWITTGKLDSSQGFLSSNFASTRYRVLLPAANLGPFGWKSEIVNEQELIDSGWGKLTFNVGDVLIVSKSLNIKTSQYIKQAKQQGCMVLVDFCDHHFDRPDEIGVHFNNLLKLADLVTTCSLDLQAIIQKKSTLPVAYITDCFESQKITPQFNPNNPIKLLWFGSNTNLDTIDYLIRDLTRFSLKNNIQLDLVTTHPNGDEVANNISTSTFKVNYIPWSQQNLALALQRCDVVVIPTLKNEHKSVKSPNRIIEPIWAGKYVVAGHLPSYEPFAPFASIGDDLMAGIEWALNNPEKVLEKITAGQAYIAANHTPKLIGEKWHEALLSLTKLGESLAPAQTLAPSSEFYRFFDQSEVSRVFNLDKIPFETVESAFKTHYPVNHEVKPAKKIAVYTAIFGGYDAPPKIINPDPDLDYVLFCDAEINAVAAPWQVRRLPRIFADPQVDARRVKVLSHLFLPDYQVTVWIDGNLSPKQLTASYVNEAIQMQPVAVCRHQFRGCIYDEAVEIIRTAKDAPSPVMRQIQFYQSLGFPQKSGLHVTMFLIRDHRDSRTLKHNNRWWEILSEYSKRDQLSFDFVRWEMQTPVLTLPFNCRENTLFQWGIDASRGHVGKVRRNDESLGRAFFQDNIQSISTYKPTYDRWTKRFLLELFDLNSQLVSANQELGSSFLSVQGVSNTPFSIPDPRNGNKYQLFQTAIAESRSSLFIGDFAEHTILFALNYSSTKTSHATTRNDQTIVASVNWFNKNFANRYICYKVERSLFERKIILDNFDTVILCDDLELSFEEINTFILKANLNTKIIALGKNIATLTTCIEQNGYQSFMHCFRGVIHSEIVSFIKQPIIEKNEQVIDQKTYQKSVYGIWLKQRESDMTWQFAMRGNYGFYFSRWVENLKKCVFIDIGANYGVYSILASKNRGIEAVYAFEPHPQTYEYLLSNLSVNQAKKCTAHRLAIATLAGTQTIYADASHSGKATLRDSINPESFSENFEITTISNIEIDQLIKLKPEQKVVVKIDVEGYEIEVIKTLIQSTLWSQITHIYCEVDKNYLDEKVLLNLMLNNHFQVQHQHGAGEHYDLMFVRT